MEIRDAKELRVKESDRIRATVDNLRRLGAKIEEFDDGFAIEGGTPLRGAEVDSFHDHRMAMAMAIAGLAAEGETVISGASNAAVSFSGFWDELAALVQ
jgi:3-phosphoshikimate 1-carboxyvinyltransferase